MRSVRAGIPLEVVGAATPDLARTSNEGSLVLRFGRAPGRVLVPGDISRETEALLLDEVPGQLRAELLIVAHHGSRSSSSPRFLRQVAPQAALISCGRANRFGHPHPELLARLRARRLPTGRTDRDGTLHWAVGPRGWGPSPRTAVSE